MRIVAEARRWWFAAAAALAVAVPLLALGGAVAQAQGASTVGLVITGTPAPGGTVSLSATGFAASETVNCTATGSAATGGTIPPVVGTLTAVGGAISGTLIIPSNVAVGSVLTVSCVGATSGVTAVGAVTVVAAAPPAIPEADVLVLFGTGLAGLGGYAAVRMRTLRRNLPF
jgi:hypothetical protein